MTLEQRLADAVGDAHVLTDRGLLASYETDWTGRFGGRARCVVRPADTGQVVAVVRACAEAGGALWPPGGQTRAGGARVPGGGAGLLSTPRLPPPQPGGGGA